VKKRCIDSAFKVIKVPKRPGQLVNEGRRKKGMMVNPQPHQNPGNREEEASGKNLGDST
jgi:hypothetical protein